MQGDGVRVEAWGRVQGTHVAQKYIFGSEKIGV